MLHKIFLSYFIIIENQYYLKASFISSICFILFLRFWLMALLTIYFKLLTNYNQYKAEFKVFNLIFEWFLWFDVICFFISSNKIKVLHYTVKSFWQFIIKLIGIFQWIIEVRSHLLQPLFLFVDLQWIVLYWSGKLITNNNKYNEYNYNPAP